MRKSLWLMAVVAGCSLGRVEGSVPSGHSIDRWNGAPHPFR